METKEIKKQLIEMIKSIDDDELLYLVKEDLVFHVTSKAMRMEAQNEDAVSHEFNDYSIASASNKISDEDSITKFMSDYL
jgi:uncharacterized protein with WD repeat